MISVIVPVYNAEKYIKDCLESILAQTFLDFELILVNDGSEDCSATICEAYEKMDARVHLYNKINEGPSEARNYGVSKSVGEYITFIDADDVVDLRYLEILSRIMDEKACDISAAKLALTQRPNYKKRLNGKIIEYDGMSATKDMLYQKNIDTSPCALLVRRKIIEANPFPAGKYHEDDFTVYKYFLAADKVCLYTEVLYFYIQRSEGIMRSTQKKVSRDEIEASNYLVHVFEKMNKELYRAALSKKFSNYCQLLLKSNDSLSDEETYRKLYSFVKSEKLRILVDPNCRIKNKIAAVSLFWGINGLRFINRLRNIKKY